MQTLSSILGTMFIVITLALTIYRCSEREDKKSREQSGPHYVLGDTYTSPFHEYSFRYPAFWLRGSHTTADTISFQAFDFPSDITTYERIFAGPVAQCVEKVKDEWRTNNPEVTVLRETEFVTDTGAVGRKVKVKTKQDAHEIGVTIYFFEITERRKLIISCRVPLEKDRDMESLFDDCMKTFAVAAQSPTPLPAGGNTRP